MREKKKVNCEPSKKVWWPLWCNLCMPFKNERFIPPLLKENLQVAARTRLTQLKRATQGHVALPGWPHLMTSLCQGINTSSLIPTSEFTLKLIWDPYFLYRVALLNYYYQGYRTDKIFNWYITLTALYILMT